MSDCGPSTYGRVHILLAPQKDTEFSYSYTVDLLAYAYVRLHIHLRLWQIVILLAFPVVLEPTTTLAVGCGSVSSITILKHHASITSNLSCAILSTTGHAGN